MDNIHILEQRLELAKTKAVKAEQLREEAKMWREKAYRDYANSMIESGDFMPWTIASDIVKKRKAGQKIDDGVATYVAKSFFGVKLGTRAKLMSAVSYREGLIYDFEFEIDKYRFAVSFPNFDKLRHVDEYEEPIVEFFIDKIVEGMSVEFCRSTSMLRLSYDFERKYEGRE